MLGLKIVCWAYMLFLVMGRIVNFDKADDKNIKVRICDNIMFLALVLILAFLK